jgi:type II secretory pathway pseudopilin PulG
MTSRAGATAGFTLLEFLVAFTMVSLFLSAVLAGLMVATRRDTQASFQSRATRLATVRLAIAEAEYGPGTASGRSTDGLAWTTRVQSYGRVPLDGDRSANGYWVEVTVADPVRPDRAAVEVFGLAIREEGRK